MQGGSRQGDIVEEMSIPSQTSSVDGMAVHNILDQGKLNGVMRRPKIECPLLTSLCDKYKYSVVFANSHRIPQKIHLTAVQCLAVL